MNSFSDQQRQQVRDLLHRARSHLAQGGDQAKIAFELVIQALTLIGGHEAVLPTLHRAVQEFQSSRASAAAVCQLSQLFSSISIQAEQAITAQTGPAGPSPAAAGGPGSTLFQQTAQQPWQHASPSQAFLGHWQAAGPAGHPAGQPTDEAMMDTDAGPAGMAAGSSAAAAAMQYSSWYSQQQPILQETGRESLTDCAVADGSSYVCMRCGGVVSAARREQHDQFWCATSGGCA